MKENIEKCLATCNLQTWKSGTAEHGGRRITEEELANLQFANLEETKRKSKVGHLARKKQKQKLIKATCLEETKTKNKVVIKNWKDKDKWATCLEETKTKK